MTLAMLLLSVVCALGQTQTTTYAFGFRIYNATCTPQTVTWHAFIAVSGNGYNVGNANVTIAAGVTTPVIVSGVIQSGVLEGYTVIVDGATQLNQDVWSYGQPCPSGGTPPVTNTIGTNIVFKTVYVPVYARVRVPGGPDTNALVRIYKKTVAVFP